MIKKITIPILFMFILFSQYPEYEIIVNNNPYPSNLFINTLSSTNNSSAILNNNLELHWSINGGIGDGHTALIGKDFKVNNDYLTYYDGEHLSWIVADKYMQEVDTLNCINNLYPDYHDIRLLENGGYILMAYKDITIDLSNIINGGSSSCNLQDILVIQEFNNNDELIFEWDAFEKLDISQYTNLNLTNNNLVWMHGNSIEIDYDQNLILSNRRSSEAIKIDRQSGDIIWILGGPANQFEILNDSFGQFSKQHDIRRLENENILVFDNGTNHSPSISRVIEYEIDENEKTANLIWEFINPYNQSAGSLGSAQRLPNDNTLINWGRVGIDGANIMEVDYNKNIVLEIKYPDGFSAYKVRKSDWEFDIPMQVGDLNLDEIINVQDIIDLVNHIINDDSIKNLFSLYKRDINKDNSINVVDIIGLVNIIIN